MVKPNPEPFEPTKRDSREQYASPMTYKEKNRVWWLVYSPEETKGNGPFRSRAKAIAWYNNGGR